MGTLRRSGLSRHIIVSMSLMVIGVIVMMILSSWLLYAVLVEFFLGSAEEPESWLPTGPELAWMVGVILTGLALAIAASFRLCPPHPVAVEFAGRQRARAGRRRSRCTRQRRGKLARRSGHPGRGLQRDGAAPAAHGERARCGTPPSPTSCARR
jgi:ABC-type multidrug transport system fused ATPase/permease subunit